LTEAAQHCAVIGGAYRYTGADTAARPEQETCTLPGGKVCDVHALFAGGCRVSR
jgi:putative hemolysin